MARHKRHREEHGHDPLIERRRAGLSYGVAGYGWTSPGWTAQTALSPAQFPSGATDFMTTTAAAPGPAAATSGGSGPSGATA